MKEGDRIIVTADYKSYDGRVLAREGARGEIILKLDGYPESHVRLDGKVNLREIPDSYIRLDSTDEANPESGVSQ